MIAALYVEKDGAYFGLPNVDPWDVERDAWIFFGAGGVLTQDPTHWMPLPEPPEFK